MCCCSSHLTTGTYTGIRRVTRLREPLGCEDRPLIQPNFEESLESCEAVTGADFEGPIEESPVTAGVSSFSATRLQPSFVMGSHGAPQDVASVLVAGRSWQDALTSGLFQTVECCCCSWVIIVYQECIAGWPVVEGGWFVVSAAGTLRDASNAQLEPCDDITELEQIDDPINASDMLKWIEQSQGVAESICVNEDLVCRLNPTEGRYWEGQILRLNYNVFSDSVRCLRGKKCIPVVVSRVSIWFGKCWSADGFCSHCQF